MKANKQKATSNEKKCILLIKSKVKESDTIINL